MELDFKKILRLRELRASKLELCREEGRLRAPLLTDRSLIAEIYCVFRELLSERDCSPDTNSVTQRKKFIFIILYLFSPSTLAGDKMAIGLRDEIAGALGIHSRTVISDNCAEVVILYCNYAGFCRDIGYIYSEIIRRLHSKGLIDWNEQPADYNSNQNLLK